MLRFLRRAQRAAERFAACPPSPPLLDAGFSSSPPQPSFDRRHFAAMPPASPPLSSAFISPVFILPSLRRFSRALPLILFAFASLSSFSRYFAVIARDDFRFRRCRRFSFQIFAEQIFSCRRFRFSRQLRHEPFRFQLLRFFFEVEDFFALSSIAKYFAISLVFPMFSPPRFQAEIAACICHYAAIIARVSSFSAFASCLSLLPCFRYALTLSMDFDAAAADDASWPAIIYANIAAAG